MKIRKHKGCWMYLTLFILLHAHGSAQSQTDSLIIGCWQIDKVAFIEPLEDSVGFMAQMKKTIVCFEHHGRFISMRKENSKTKTVAAGKYCKLPHNSAGAFRVSKKMYC